MPYFNESHPRILHFLPTGTEITQWKERFENFGYILKSVSDRENLLSELIHPETIALITDLTTLEDEITAPELNEYLRRSGCSKNLIYLGHKEDLDSRLYAARSGGAAYFTGTPDPEVLIETLEKLNTPTPSDPYRVLIIEDSMIQARLTDAVLTMHGFETQVIHDPRHALTTLNHFRPDLILSDLYMPYCSGFELARVIHQQPNLSGIPIIFLSLEKNIDQHLKALDMGADDFLTKPIHPEHLTRAILARIQRAKKMQALMSQDSLTGLLNHASILEKFNVEKARAIREKTHLTFIMIDIDHFKKINDTYGHAMGDQVLKDLSHFLQKRLRKTDLIGRYGGEEFVMILPRTDTEQAYSLLDEIRTGISQLKYSHHDDSFSITLSAGIASLNFENPDLNLAAIADERLYKAKRRGRNQVISI